MHDENKRSKHAVHWMSKNLLKLNHDQTDFQGNDDFLFENIKIGISDPFLFFCDDNWSQNWLQQVVMIFCLEIFSNLQWVKIVLVIKKNYCEFKAEGQEFR